VHHYPLSFILCPLAFNLSPISCEFLRQPRYLFFSCKEKIDIKDHAIDFRQPSGLDSAYRPDAA
jgi:hypothetical protein